MRCAWSVEGAGWALPTHTPASKTQQQQCCASPFHAPNPQAYTFLGWIVGMGPLGYIFNLTGAGRVLLNMLKAHTLTYNRLKDLHGGAEAQVSVCLGLLRFLAVER